MTNVVCIKRCKECGDVVEYPNVIISYGVLLCGYCGIEYLYETEADEE